MMEALVVLVLIIIGGAILMAIDDGIKTYINHDLDQKTKQRQFPQQRKKPTDQS